MTKILEVHTEHTAPFKILIEVLKDMIQEANIEFIMDNINNAHKNKIDLKKIAAIKEDKDAAGNSDSDYEESDTESDESSSDDESKKNNDSNNVVDRSGMKILAVDTTTTVLIHVKLEARNFTRFKCRKRRLLLGVNLGCFHKLIKSMDKEDNLTLFYDDDNRSVLNIKIDSALRKDLLKLKLMDLGDGDMSLPNIVFDSVVTISATAIHKLCREMSTIADYVEIQCFRDRIIFSCKGDYAERITEYRVGNDNGEQVDIKQTNNDSNAPQVIQGIYELKNLVLFGKCASLCGAMQIYMKNKKPLVIKYTVANLGRILLCLSPINTDNVMNNNYEEENELYSDEELEYK